MGKLNSKENQSLMRDHSKINLSIFLDGVNLRMKLEIARKIIQSYFFGSTGGYDFIFHS
jgi:hypothetical protein